MFRSNRPSSEGRQGNYYYIDIIKFLSYPEYIHIVFDFTKALIISYTVMHIKCLEVRI
jgi:hypothetical protein